MLTNEDLQAIAQLLQPIKNDIIEMKNDISEMKNDIAIIREDGDITRAGVERIFSWATDPVAVTKPIK